MDKHLADVLAAGHAPARGATAGLQKCGGCGGMGAGLLTMSGFCAHCTRQGVTKATVAAGAASGAGGSTAAVSGVKRKHKDMHDTDAAEAEVAALAAAATSGNELSEEDLARLMEAADKTEVPTLDAVGVKRLLVSIERKITKNQLARAKYGGEPVRYMESELELDEELKRLRVLAAAPDQYPVLIESSTLGSLLSLLSHENSDIASDVIALLSELTDEDALGDDEEAAGVGDDEADDADDDHDDVEDGDGDDDLYGGRTKRGGSATGKKKAKKLSPRQCGCALVDALASGGVMDLLVSNLTRLEASGSEEDATAIYNSMALVENVVTLRPTLAAAICTTPSDAAATGSSSSAAAGAARPSRFLVFLLRRLRARAFDDIKGYAAELLSILLQADVGSGEVARVLGAGPFTLPPAGAGAAAAASASAGVSVDGMEFLLECANVYKKRAPAGSAEEECVENLFAALCTLLLLPENQNRFRRAEGTELMLRMVAEAGFVRYSALKVLSYAVSAPTARNAETLVDAGGLKELFPAFMGKGAHHTKKTHGNDAAKDEELRAVSIVASCMALLPHPQPATLASGKLGDVSGAGSGVQRLRLLAKFKENAYEKVDRLIELLRKYADKVAAAAADSDDDDDDEDDGDDEVARKLRGLREEARYLRRLDAGLFVLQQAASIVARLVVAPEEIVAAAAGAAAGAAPVPVHPSLLKMCEEVSFAARSKLYEQGGSLTAIIDVLQEQADRLGASDDDGATSSGDGGGLASTRATQRASLLALVDEVKRAAGIAAANGRTVVATTGAAAAPRAGAAASSAIVEDE